MEFRLIVCSAKRDSGASGGVKVFKSHEEQEAWDIQYYISLSPEERQRIARKLRERYYGPNPPRIREVRPKRYDYIREAAKKAG